jgi:hypothetical protein
VKIAASQTTSGASTYSNPKTSGVAVTLTGQAPGYTNATCQFTTS